MKTRSRWFSLRGLYLLSGALAFGFMLVASASAGPMTYRETTTSGRPHQAQEMPAHQTPEIFVLTSASAIPRPIRYVIGGIVTTPSPVQIIGRGTNIVR